MKDTKFSPLVEEAINETPLYMRNDIPRGGMNAFLDNLVRSFIAKKVESFPLMCKETMRVNRLHNIELEKHGNWTSTKMVAGTVYNGTPGWSKDKLFQHKWIIPNDLLYFMRNCIYRGFWEDENAKVRDSFMKAILRGEDPLTLLAKVRAHYGADTEPTIGKSTLEESSI